VGQRPTIRDVAAEAGVSLKTVSRVLNRERWVAPATALRVLAAVDALGYQRHEPAANLRRLGQSTSIIGLVIEDLANPFYSVLARAVEEVARDHQYLLMVACSDEDPAKEVQVIRALCASRVDGLIVVPTGAEHSFLLPEMAAGTAVVFVDRPGVGVDSDTVVATNARGTAEAVTHLLDRGHRRIGYLGDDPEIYTAAERYAGYCRALESAGIEVDEALVKLGVSDVAGAEAAAEELMGRSDPPTAVVGGNNRLTIGALRATRRDGRPVAVVGFDDFELADMLDPPVTVVSQDAFALGHTAAELLFRRLGGDRRPAQQVMLGTTLVIRGSGDVGVHQAEGSARGGRDLVMRPSARPRLRQDTDNRRRS
jgi:LacI family transcriptional regulator, galactose operon repressor